MPNLDEFFPFLPRVLNIGSNVLASAFTTMAASPLESHASQQPA